MKMNINDIQYTHNRKSIRLKNYDYSQQGMYYVTICVHKKRYLFGNIVNRQMRCNDAGKMLWQMYDKIEVFFPGIKCDECIVMPNHIHFIVINEGVGKDYFSPDASDNCKSTSLYEIIRWWKIVTTNHYIKGVKQNGWARFEERLWQRNYWEKVIRDEMSLYETRKYIRYNAQKWETDPLNIEVP